jgi:DNA repair exonuclease SbcCD ATPase subunit
MKLKKVLIKDMVFDGERSLDVSSLGGVVCLSGPPGSGKSSFLEIAYIGSLYRTLPSRDPGTLTSVATSKAAVVDCEWEIGALTVRVLHEVGKGKAHVYVDGQPAEADGLTSNGKFKVFDSIIQSIFGPLDMMLALSFCAQMGDGSFSASSQGEMRSLATRILGLDKMQDIANTASIVRKVAQSKLDLIGPEIERADEILDRESGLKTLIGEAAAESLELNDTALQALDDLKSLEKVLDETKDFIRLSGLNESLDKKSRSRDELLAQGGGVGARIAELEILVEILSERKALWERHKSAKDRIGQIRVELAGIAHIPTDDLYRGVGVLSALVADGGRVCDDWSAKHERANSLKWTIKANQSDANDLCKVPCGGEGEFSGCPLIEKAVKAKARIEPDTSEMQGLLADMEAMDYSPDAHMKNARELKVAMAELDSAIEHNHGSTRLSENLNIELSTLLSSFQEVDPFDHAEWEVATAELAAVRSKKNSITLDMGSLQNSIDTEEIERGRLLERNPTNHNISLTQAEERVAALQAEVDRCAAERHRIEGQILAMQSEYDNLKIDWAWKINEAAGSDRADLIWEKDIATRIEKAFGPKGMQAILVDSAAPAIGGYATDLLEVVLGERVFEVSIETQAAKSDGGLKDVFVPSVNHLGRGWSGPIANASGGEKDMLQTALLFALAKHRSETSGAKPTFFVLDEMAKCLNDDWRNAWFEMVRRAMVDLGAGVVWVVTHQESLKLQADVVIDVEEM